MSFRRVVALSGGVGGARFVDGLAQALGPETELIVIVNTGDDFTHLGLRICPDLDTVMYTLSGLGHEERGWGLAEESFAMLGLMKRLGGPDWFNLGDRDLATHLLRSELLRSGAPLSVVTARLTASLGIGARLLPMSDEPRPTLIDTTEEGTLSFQDWLVRRRGADPVKAVRFGGGAPVPGPGVIEALAAADVILMGPSNGYVSIDPILALDGVRTAAAPRPDRPVVAVSPIVAGKAVKGPLAGMIATLAGETPSAAAVAKHYRGAIAGIVVENGDEEIEGPVRVLATSTVMRSRADRERLARETLAFAADLAR